MSREMASIREAAGFLGVTPQTLRRWERQGWLLPDERTPGGQRRYNLGRLQPEHLRDLEAAGLTIASAPTLAPETARPTIASGTARRTMAYARVSGDDQKNNLERQKQVLKNYCARQGRKLQGRTCEVIADSGSGTNDHRKGLKRLLDAIIDGQVGRLVITHQDRLRYLDAELVFAICEAKNVEVVILNQPDLPGEDTRCEDDLSEDDLCEDDLTEDVRELIAVFSARLSGSRPDRDQKLIDGVKVAVETAPDRSPTASRSFRTTGRPPACVSRSEQV